ncbi:B-block binding subunit of TFIIIC [Phaffia rhodozyma]|uniref:B-block binding subunit of TFIIIC n=1 Tax=Phaffia rhodozyma TaxID=264483 RepID=A0A0F7SQ97_PHARH|nr:B-block binding subunit of TFIIIC [Phaffia rhodozyma]
MSGPLGIHPDSIIDLAKLHYTQQAKSTSHDPSLSSGKSPQKLDAAFLSYLWDVLIEQDDVRVGREESFSPDGVEIQRTSEDLPSRGKKRAVGLRRRALEDEREEGQEEDQEYENEEKVLRNRRTRADKSDTPVAVRAALVDLDEEELFSSDLWDLKKDHGAKLRIALSEDKAYFIMTGTHRGKLALGDQMYQALTLISQSKTQGITTISLTDVMGLDPKTIHYFTKSLLSWNLISKFQAYAHGTHTAIHFHSRYTTQSAEYLTLRGTASAAAAATSLISATDVVSDPKNADTDSAQQPLADELGELPQTMFSYLDVVQHRILHVLARNSQGIARRETLLRDIGYKGVVGRQQQRMLARCIRHIVTRGEIRRVYLRNSNPEGKFASLERGFQLIKKAEKNGEGSEDVMSDHEEEEEDEEMGDTISEEDENALVAAIVDGSEPNLIVQDSAVTDRPAVEDIRKFASPKRFEPMNKMEPSTSIEYQIMRMLQVAGATGVTCQSITHELKVDRKFVDHFLERFAKQPVPPNLSHRGLVSLADVLGKEKLIYAFDTEGYLLQCKEHGFTPDAHAFPAPDPVRARGFLDLTPYEFYVSKSQHIAWNSSFTQGHFGPMILRMPVLAFFNPCIPPEVIYIEDDQDERKPVTRARQKSSGRTSIVANSPPNIFVRPKTKGSGQQYKRGIGKSTYAQLQRIAMGVEPLPMSGSERRRIIGRAESEGVDISKAVANWHQARRGAIAAPDSEYQSSSRPRQSTIHRTTEATPTASPAVRRGRPPKAKSEAFQDLSDICVTMTPSSTPTAPRKRGRKKSFLAADDNAALSAMTSTPTLPKRRGRPPLKAKSHTTPSESPSVETPQGSVDDLLIVNHPSPSTVSTSVLVDEGCTPAYRPRKRARFSGTANLKVNLEGTPKSAQKPSSVLINDLESPLSSIDSFTSTPQSSRPLRKSSRLSALPAASEALNHSSVAHPTASPLPTKEVLESTPSATALNGVVSSHCSNKAGIYDPDTNLKSGSINTSISVGPLKRRSSAPRTSLHGPSHAQTKRDKFFVDWIESLGGVHDISSNSPLHLQRYLETAIANASAKGVHLRLNATTMIDKKTWSASLERLVNKNVLKTRTVAVEVNGSMLTIKFVFLTDTPETKIQEEIRRLASLAEARGKKVLASKVADQRTAAQRSRPKGVVEADMGPQPLTERERLYRATMVTMEKEAEEKRAFFAGKAAQKRIQLGDDWLALAKKHLTRMSVTLTPTLELNIRAVQQLELAQRSGGRLDETHIASLVQELLDLPEGDRPLPQETPMGRQKKGTRVRRPKISDVYDRVNELQHDNLSEIMDIPFFLPVTEEDDDLIPASLRGPPEESDPLGPRRRTRFTDELDDMIMDLGAILETRGREHGFMFTWKPATKVITSLNHNILRHRYSVLRERLGKKTYINGLSEAYSRLWKAHRGTINLPEPAGARSTEFDIVHHVKFFRKNTQKNHLLNSIVEGQLAVTPTTVSIVPPLPSKVSGLKDWKFTSPEPESNHWNWLLELSAAVTAEFAEKKTLEAPFAIEPLISSKKDLPVISRFSREQGVIGSTIKMIVNPTTRTSDPDIAEKILPQTPLVDTVHASLMRSGVISKIGKSKAPPTRFFEISEGFMKQSEGPYEPTFFDEAGGVHNPKKDDTLLLEEEHSIWPLVASEGATAKLINMVSDNRVEFIVDREEMENLAGRGMIDTKKLDDEDLEFHTYVRITQPAQPVNLHTDIYLANPSSDLRPAHIDPERRKQALITLQHSGAGEWVEPFEEGLMRAGKDGLTWEELIDLTSSSPVSNILHFAHCFCETTPSLSFWAGYDEARLVSSAFFSDWSVEIPKDNELVYPRKWVDFQGKILQKEWEKNVRCVVGTLMHRPYVNEWLLRKVLDPILDRPELNDILRHLFKRGWARRVTFHEATQLAHICSVKPIGWLSREEEKWVGWCLIGEDWLENAGTGIGQVRRINEVV